MFSGQTIYVVDDDKPALNSLRLLLTAEGYAVRFHRIRWNISRRH